MIDQEYLHVTPVNDLRDHIESVTCWCNPTPHEEYPNLLIHHSMDRREEYENGRKMS